MKIGKGMLSNTTMSIKADLMSILDNYMFRPLLAIFRLSSRELKILLYTECPRRNVPDFGRVFLMLKYTDITQNTYIQSWTVTEIMARKVGASCGSKYCNLQSWYVRWQCQRPWEGNAVFTVPASRFAQSAMLRHLRAFSCRVLGTLRTTMTRVECFCSSI